jgi:hypothetical protein
MHAGTAVPARGDDVREAGEGAAATHGRAVLLRQRMHAAGATGPLQQAGSACAAVAAMQLRPAQRALAAVGSVRRSCHAAASTHAWNTRGMPLWQRRQAAVAPMQRHHVAEAVHAAAAVAEQLWHASAAAAVAAMHLHPYQAWQVANSMPVATVMQQPEGGA